MLGSNDTGLGSIPTAGDNTGGGGSNDGVQSVVAGTGITVNNADPQNPIVSATGGAGGIVDAVVAGNGITVDDSDPANPIVTNDGVRTVSAGTGIGVTVGHDPTISNTGILSATAGTGIGVTAGQNPTISNTGILSVTAGTGISVTAGQNPTISNNGVTSVTAGTNITVTGTSTAPVVNAADQTANFAAITYKGTAGTPQNIGPLATGVLQTTNAANVSTVSSASVPAGIVPVGAAAGTGLLRVDAKMFYYEASSARPRLIVGTGTTLATETNIDAALGIFAANLSSRAAVLELHGNDTSDIFGYQTSDGLQIGNIHFQDGPNGATSGAIQINARQSTGGGGAVVESLRASAAGTLIPKVLAVGVSGIDESITGASIWIQNSGTVAAAPGGTGKIRWDGTGQWAQLSCDGGNFADFQRASQATNAASASTLTLPSDGTLIHVTGSVTINYATSARIRAGQRFWLIFDAGTTVNNNAASVPGGTLAFFLIGGANFTYAANDKSEFVWDTGRGGLIELTRTAA